LTKKESVEFLECLRSIGKEKRQFSDVIPSSLIKEEVVESTKLKKRTLLKVIESSAFFSFIKSNMPNQPYLDDPIVLSEIQDLFSIDP
jgi:hypothetical protein